MHFKSITSETALQAITSILGHISDHFQKGCRQDSARHEANISSDWDKKCQGNQIELWANAKIL